MLSIGLDEPSHPSQLMNTIAIIRDAKHVPFGGLPAQGPALQQSSPEGLLQAVVQLLVPLVSQELDNLLPAREADAVDVPLRVCKNHTSWSEASQSAERVL